MISSRVGEFRGNLRNKAQPHHATRPPTFNLLNLNPQSTLQSKPHPRYRQKPSKWPQQNTTTPVPAHNNTPINNTTSNSNRPTSPHKAPVYPTHHHPGHPSLQNHHGSVHKTCTKHLNLYINHNHNHNPGIKDITEICRQINRILRMW